MVGLIALHTLSHTEYMSMADCFTISCSDKYAQSGPIGSGRCIASQLVDCCVVCGFITVCF